MEDHKFIPEITNEPFPPAFETPESYNQLNTILSYYKFPNIELSDNSELKIIKLKEICKSKYLNNIELTSISKLLQDMKEYKQVEKLCDNWEIELANMNSESSRKYGSKSIEELKSFYEDLKKSIAVQDKFEENRDLIEGICRLDKNALSSLTFMKEETFGAYAKQKVVDKLIGRTEEWAVVLSKIVQDHQCRVESLKNELGIDRVNLLRIIYNYSAKGILEYDRLNDTVSIVDN